MRHNIFSFFLLCNLLVVSTCSLVENTNVQADHNLQATKTLNEDNRSDNINFPQNQEKSYKLLKVESKQPVGWIGVIDAENLETPQANGNIWSNADLDNDKKYNQIGTAIEVDILNCGGYLISGKLKKEGEYGWVLVTNRETAAKDALDKLKQCDSNFGNGFPSSNAFAIAPSDNRRQNIKIGDVDTRKLFRSLPREEKQWLDKKLNLPKEYQRKEKANLTLREDSWTDINGDGEIDLLMLTTVCRADDSEGDKCGGIFLRVKGKWIEIGSISKA